MRPDRRLSILSLKTARSDFGGWTNKTVVSTFGVSVGVRTDDAALLVALCQWLPPSAAKSPVIEADLQYSMYSRPADDSGRVQPLYVGHAGERLFIQTLDRAKACDAFASTVKDDLAATSSDWVFVHAGVVSWQGAAIVIPAPGLHGTSRLVEALARAGATYYSDEYAVIDQHGRVHPFAIPLSLRTETGAKERAPTQAPAAPLPPLPVRTIVATRHEPGAVWRPRRGTPGEALLTLLSNTTRARRASRAAMDVLARAVEGAELLEGPRGEAEAVAAALIA